MELLNPDWNQQKPSVNDALSVCDRVELSRIDIESSSVVSVLNSLQAAHLNGRVLFAAVRIGGNPILDWFGSRNRLLEFDVLPRLLQRPEMREWLPGLLPEGAAEPSLSATEGATCSPYGLKLESPFTFDATLATTLYQGGAYHSSEGDGKAEKELAIAFCDALFEQRYGEMAYFVTFDAWSPWFYDVAWDWTAVLWDRRKRVLFVLAVTDTD